MKKTLLSGAAALAFLAVPAFSQPVILDLTGVLEDPAAVIDETAVEDVPVQAAIAEPQLSEAPANVPARSRRLSLDIDIDVDDLLGQADLSSRFERLNLAEFQPDTRVPFLTVLNSMGHVLSIDSSTVTPENIAIYGAHFETGDCRDASRLLTEITPSERRALVERASSAVSVEPFVMTDHVVRIPGYDADRGIFLFPSFDLGEHNLNLSAGRHATYEFSQRGVREESNRRCRLSSGGFMSGSAVFEGPTRVSPMKTDMATADRLFRASTRASDGSRVVMARVVSKPSGIFRNEKGENGVFMSPERIHLYGGTAGRYRDAVAQNYLISYEISSETWYYDLPVIDRNGREISRERIIVSEPEDVADLEMVDEE